METLQPTMKDLELARQLLLQQIAEAERLFPAVNDESVLLSMAALNAINELISDREKCRSAE